MKHQQDTGATRREPWPRKLVAAVCAVALALLSVPLGVFHTPEIARAESYTVPADAQASGTSSSCSWYITSASDASNPGQLFIYPTDGTSGTLSNFYSESAVPWYSNAANIQSVLVASGVKTSYAFSFAFLDCSNATTIDLTNLDTGKATDLEALFKNCSSLTSIPGLESLDVADVTDFSSLFLNCKSLPSADLSGWDLSSATDIDYLFDTCNAIQSIKLPSTVAPNITSASQAFNNCKQITSLDVSCLENGRLQYISGMFQSCQKLVDLTGYEDLVTSSTTRMTGVFSACNSLTSLDLSNWDTQNATNFFGLFANCKSLTSLVGLDQWNTSNVTSLLGTFQDVSKMTTIPGITNWDVSNVSSFYQTFTDCTALTSLDLSGWNTVSGTTFDYMFGECENLQVLDISGFDTSAATNLSGMFTLNNRLQQVTLGSNFTFNGSGSTRLTNLPTPDPTYITGATGKWQAVGAGTVSEPAGTVYLPAEVPNNVAETYVIEKEAPLAIPTLAKMDTWYTQGGTSITKDSITTINIVNEYTPTGDETASWDASSALDGSVMAYVSADGTTLTIAGNGYGKIFANQNSRNAFKDFTAVTAINGATLLDTSNATDMGYMFRSDEKLVTLDVSNWDTSSCTNMSDMFYWCKAVTQLDVSGWQTGNVVYMDDLFGACESVTTLDVGTWDVSSCKNMNRLFYGCSKISTLDVSSWETGACTNMAYLFAYCYSLENFDVSNWDVSKVTTMDHMFSGTSSTAINMDNWDTSSCENYEFMFWNCGELQELNVNHFSFDAGTTYSLEATFACCDSLTALNLSNWTSPKIVNLDNTFQGCTNLASLTVNGWDTSNVTDFTCCFYKCENLKVLDLSGWDTQSATSATKMFDECVHLRQVTLDGDFSFNGSTATRLCNLPTPDPTYIPGANGKWQAVGTGTVIAPAGTIYDPADVPNNVAETYVMPLVGVDIDVPIRVTLALDANGDFCTPTATDNKIINHTVVGAKVVSAVAAAQSGFQLVQAGDVGSSTQANAFGGTITAGSGAASDLSSISTTGSNWTMAAGSVTDGSNQIALQLTGGIRNTGSGLLAAATHVFGITYTFDLDI